MGIESLFYVSREIIAEKKEKPGKWPFRAKFDGAYVWGDNRKAGNPFVARPKENRMFEVVLSSSL